MVWRYGCGVMVLRYGMWGDDADVWGDGVGNVWMCGVMVWM